MRLRRRMYMLVCPNREKRRKEWGDKIHSFLQAYGGNRKKWENLKRRWDQKTCRLCGAELKEVIRE